MTRIPVQVADMVKARAGGHCELWIAGVCTTRIEQLHHRRMRSQQGRHTVRNLVGVCNACHGYVHRNPRESYENGWLVHSWADPNGTPVVRRARETLLLEDGRVQVVS